MRKTVEPWFVFVAVVSADSELHMRQFDPISLWIVDTLFLALFCGEIALSVWINGWPRYWHSRWKRADFTIIALSLASKILVECIAAPIVQGTTKHSVR